MKKALKIIGKILLWIFIIIISLLVICGVVNRIMRKGEKDLLTDDRCQMIEIDGKNMSIYTEGEGNHTIVLMSGWGTSSPMYNFRPLTEKLSDDYKVVVLEKFGYGFSDDIDDNRDLDTILRQNREVLQKAGIEAPYILCPHSLSGLEAVYWAQKYPDEVEAIVGLDMSTTALNEMGGDKLVTLEKIISKFMALSGISRPLNALSDMPECHNAEEKKQYIAICADNEANISIMKEIGSLMNDCEKIDNLPLPETPTLQFISGQNKESKPWIDSHQEIVDASSNGKMVQLECGHYVHSFESEIIAKEMKAFISDLEK